MGYKRITTMEILEIARRYFNKETIKSISQQSGLDRKTVRKYIRELNKEGITAYDREKIISVAVDIYISQIGFGI
jgi:predicted transcriptional regulator